MKNVLTTLMTSAALLFTIGSGLQAQSIHLHAAVPFAWQLNGHQMNAGDYEISQDAASVVTRIRNSATGKGSFVMTRPDDEKNSTARLVFHRYGSRYFLAEIVAPGRTAATLPVSSAEKEAMQSGQAREVATVFIDTKSVVN